MTVDVEQRLRATYQAVAEQTTVGVVDPPTPGEALVVPLDQRRRRRPRALAAAAAVAAALVVGLVVVNGSGDPAATDLARLTPTLRHGALSRPPEGFGLVRVDAPRGRLFYVGPSGNITLTVAEGPTSFGVSDAQPTSVIVRGRVGSLLTADAVQVLQWTEREGVYVALEVYGDIARTGDVVALADSVLMLSDDAWNVLTDRSGFGELPVMEGLDEAVVDDDMPAPDPEPGDWEVGGQLTRSVWGTLQNGLFVRFGNQGFSPPANGPTATVREFYDVVFVLAPVGTDRADVVVDGTTVASAVPVADPAAPSLLVATIEVEGAPDLRGTARVVFRDRTGARIDEVGLG